MTSPQTGDWQSTLRAKGYRLTPQRELVLGAVQRLGHATPEDVLRVVREESQAVNISTVYRALELLEQLGLVNHAHLGDRAPTYHVTSAPAHAHLVCRDCQGITEVGADVLIPFTDGLRDAHGFTVDVGHLTVFGLCADCSKDGGDDG